MKTKGQYTVGSPSSKRLTIVDSNTDPSESWEIQNFYCKNIEDVNGAKQDTKRVRVKVRDKRWEEADVPPLKPRQLWGDDVVFTHKKVNYDVYSGHVDDVTEKNKSRYLDLYVTEVSDR